MFDKSKINFCYLLSFRNLCLLLQMYIFGTSVHIRRKSVLKMMFKVTNITNKYSVCGFSISVRSIFMVIIYKKIFNPWQSCLIWHTKRWFQLNQNLLWFLLEIIKNWNRYKKLEKWNMRNWLSQYLLNFVKFKLSHKNIFQSYFNSSILFFLIQINNITTWFLYHLM